MKQLKFMLAAATVIGLATAAHADPLSEEYFNTMNVGDKVTGDTAGFDYNGAAAENDSEIVQVTSGNNALKVNTGTDPLLRHVWPAGGTDIDLTETNLESLDIDTKVKFTVTPWTDDVEAKAGDKLMIYLKESKTDVDGVLATNLVVVAGRVTVTGAGGDDFEDNPANEGITVVPDTVVIPTTTIDIDINKWYDLKVSSYVENDVILFGIKIGNIELETSELLFADATKGLKAFPSLVNGLDTNGDPVPKTVTYVGFAGEGYVDDIVVTKSLAATPVDFILYLGTGVSAVSYTVDDGEEATLTAASNKLNGISFEIKTISYAPGYSAGSVVAGTYDAADLEVNATKATIDTEGDDATTGAAVGFAGTAFAATTGEPLVKLINWTGANRVSADVVNAMSFDSNGNPPGVSTAVAIVPEEAYLLNCALSFEAIEQAKEDFVLTADDLTALMADPTATEGLSVSDKYNGTLTIKGATTLEDGGDWAEDKPNAKFFKAFLTK